MFNFYSKVKEMTIKWFKCEIEGFPKNVLALLFLTIIFVIVYFPVLQYSYVYHDGVWFFHYDSGSFNIHPLLGLN